MCNKFHVERNYCLMNKIIKYIKTLVISVAKKSLVFRKFVRKTILVYRKFVYFILTYNETINNHLIIFEAYLGKRYACSPKAIYEAILQDKRFKDYEFIWAFEDPKSHQDTLPNASLKRTTLVTYGSKEYFKYYGQAKYWISNSRIPEQINKKTGQIYVQCWHGTPLKRLGYDIIIESKNALNTEEEITEKYDLDAKRYSYMLSPSKFVSEKYISAFNLKKVQKGNPALIVEQGYPRNDFLYNYSADDVKKIKEQLKLPTNKKIILYAPTWRDDQHSASLGYTYQTEVNFDYLKKELSQDYIILFRAHYFVANKFDFKKYQNFIYDVSNIDDINYLYIISDVLITDYSSVFFDYANLRRPIIFFMYDLEYYTNQLRGFYFDLAILPGEIVKTENALIKILADLDTYQPAFSLKYEKFNQQFNYLDDGQASLRVIDTIFKD